LEYEIETRDLNIITKTNYPSDGIKVVMIDFNGAPIELMEFDKNKYINSK
jgi:hypothetical protein